MTFSPVGGWPWSGRGRGPAGAASPVALVAGSMRGPNLGAGSSAAASAPRQAPTDRIDAVRRIGLARPNTSSIGLSRSPSSRIRTTSAGAAGLSISTWYRISVNPGGVVVSHSSMPAIAESVVDGHPDRGQLDAVLRRPEPIAHRQAAPQGDPHEHARRRRRTGATERGGQVGVDGPLPFLGRAVQTVAEGRHGSIGGVAEVGATAEGGLEPPECVGDRVHLECSPPGLPHQGSFGRSTEILPERPRVVKRCRCDGRCSIDGYTSSAMMAAALAAPSVSTARTVGDRPISSAMTAATWSGSASA